ncbi:MAG TPA: tRNA dihydrouridine synthase DusB [Spirochaetota bacterium]|nr:tRNA dihydrouridine synthase DusB [Spirochaetota bacterium]HPI90568.1 tRNA dihydrouridine synthase DusB [Spirochaetota bacterium]HPR49260.1 tRNA dihydrouridine synthase DusB [Spirochaetota bacterium]
MNLGGIPIESPLLLAPIAGFTDSPFRKIARKHGAGLVVTELVSAEGLVRNNPKTMDLLRFDEDERPAGIQIFGNNADVMGRAATVVERHRPDFIDINIGCPARKVCGTGAGAALLLDPERIFGIVRAVREHVSLPVTAKIRIGWDQGSMNYREAARAVEEGGASVLFVHGRTKKQGYSGAADWDVIAEIRRMARIPVVGNGDISGYDDAFEKMNSSGCPAVMIGRGALGNPWIFSGTKPSLVQIREQVLEHCSLMTSFYGPYGIILMRKHLALYVRGMENASAIRARLMSASTLEEVMTILSGLAG